MTQVGRITRVGGDGGGTNNKGSGPKTKHENTAKVARRRKAAKAVENLHPSYPSDQEDYLLPVRQLDASDDELEHIGDLIAGVTDFKVLRGSIAVLSLATSTDYAHLLTDASMISRGNVIVARLYQVRRAYVFGADDDEEGGDEDDE